MAVNVKQLYELMEKVPGDGIVKRYTMDCIKTFAFQNVTENNGYMPNIKLKFIE